MDGWFFGGWGCFSDFWLLTIGFVGFVVWEKGGRGGGWEKGEGFKGWGDEKRRGDERE